MANERKRSDDLSIPDQDRGSDMSEERVRGGAGDDLRGVADEGDEDFEDMEDLEEEEDDGSF